MVKEDIHNLKGVLERNSEKYILLLFQEDQEDIKAIASAAYTTRDKAFILSLYDSGCRIGECLPLKLKHLSFDKYGAILRVAGKTGDRRIRLVASAIALQN